MERYVAPSEGAYGGTLPFEQITAAKLKNFKLYLLNNLHNNSAWLYYMGRYGGH